MSLKDPWEGRESKDWMPPSTPKARKVEPFPGTLASPDLPSHDESNLSGIERKVGPLAGSGQSTWADSIGAGGHRWRWPVRKNKQTKGAEELTTKYNLYGIILPVRSEWAQ